MGNDTIHFASTILSGKALLQQMVESLGGEGHRDLLRFNYDLNSFMRKESGAAQVINKYQEIAVGVRAQFHDLFERGKKDGTIRTDLQEESMFSGPFHIMLAAITRYSVGLLYLTRPEEEERELIVLRDLLYDHMTVKREA